MPATHELRRERLRLLAADAEADALLVTRLVNVRYLTGFTGSNAALLVTPDRAVLATDGRYTTQAEEQAPDVELLVDRQCAAALVRRAGWYGLRKLGFEAHGLTVAEHASLADLDSGPDLVALGRMVESLRVVKDEDEIALLREACAIGDRALTTLFERLRPGRTERDVARELESLLLDGGADGIAFDTIVASGPNSAVPHHRPTGRELERGDLVKVDFGALVGGYHADCTRTAVLGPPADWQREVHEVVRQAQAAGREALVTGAATRDVDAAARDVVVAAGHGEDFPHGLGHGVGLEIHEAPLMGYDADGRLADRTPVTVEPGVYLPGRGGVRIEDTLVVRDGGPELLTTTPRDLLVL